MCKTWTFAYSCGHEHTVRLSKCGGAFPCIREDLPRSKAKRNSSPTSGKRKGTVKPACLGSSVLELKAPQPCRTCTREAAEQALESKVEEWTRLCNQGQPQQLILLDGSTAELDDKEEPAVAISQARDRELYRLHKMFGTNNDSYLVAPQRRARSPGLSPLRRELGPDDIEDSYAVVACGWAVEQQNDEWKAEPGMEGTEDLWNDGDPENLLSLEEEIAASNAEKQAAIDEVLAALEDDSTVATQEIDENLVPENGLFAFAAEETQHSLKLPRFLPLAPNSRNWDGRDIPPLILYPLSLVWVGT